MKPPTDMRFAPSPVPPCEADRRLAELLHLLLQYRAKDEADGIRFVDEAGRKLPPLACYGK